MKYSFIWACQRNSARDVSWRSRGQGPPPNGPSSPVLLVWVCPESSPTPWPNSPPDGDQLTTQPRVSCQHWPGCWCDNVGPSPQVDFGLLWRTTQSSWSLPVHLPCCPVIHSVESILVLSYPLVNLSQSNHRLNPGRPAAVWPLVEKVNGAEVARQE